MEFDCNHGDPRPRRRVVRINRAAFLAAVHAAIGGEIRHIAAGEADARVRSRLNEIATAIELGMRPKPDADLTGNGR
jgi:hypothetical protein